MHEYCICIVVLIDSFLNMCDAECSGTTSQVCWKMGGNLYYQHICGGVGPSRRVWIWRVGQHGELHTPDWHIWTLHKVLPMPSTASTTYAAASAQRHRAFPTSPPSSCTLRIALFKVQIETHLWSGTLGSLVKLLTVQYMSLLRWEW